MPRVPVSGDAPGARKPGWGDRDVNPLREDCGGTPIGYLNVRRPQPRKVPRRREQRPANSARDVRSDPQLWNYSGAEMTNVSTSGEIEQ